MNPARKQPEEAVVRSRREELQSDWAGGIFLVLAVRSCPGAQFIRKRTEMKLTLRVDEVNLHRGDEWFGAVLLCGIVWRKESGAGHDAVESAKNSEPEGEFSREGHRFLRLPEFSGPPSKAAGPPPNSRRRGTPSRKARRR